MPADIDPALAALSDDDLVRLRELADDAAGPTAGFPAALAHIADYELHRRVGVDFEWLPLTGGDRSCRPRLKPCACGRVGG